MGRTVVALLPLVLALVAHPAAAGGGAFLQPTEQYAVVGDTVTAEAVVSTHIRHTGRIEDGHWRAYLLPPPRWIDPPHIPAIAVPLGTLTIERTGAGQAVARITFSVPDVDPGDYNISICDTPCQHTNLGDLNGGWFTVARTDTEAVLMRLVDETETQISRAR
jgi:hypothetical protein